MAEGDMIVTTPKKIDFIDCAINPEYTLKLQMIAKRNGVAEVSVFFQKGETKINTDEKLIAHLISVNPCPPVLGKRFALKKVEEVTEEMMESCNLTAAIILQSIKNRLRIRLHQIMDEKYIQETIAFQPEHKRERYAEKILRTRTFGYEFIASRMPQDFFANVSAIAAGD